MKKFSLFAFALFWATMTFAADVYYVSATGTSRADGMTPATPKKDLQAMLNYLRDNHIQQATIRVAEGNYLGTMDAGYIEIYTYVTMEGGWSSDFSIRNPQRYVTRIEPGEAQRATNAGKALIQINKALNAGNGTDRLPTLTIDGFCLNYGYENVYLKTGQMDDNTPPQINHALIHSDGWITGIVYIRNCVLANSPYFGIQIGSRRGKVVISNNVFVSNRYSAVRVDSGDKNGKATHVIFHHNTVLFSWTRDRQLSDMGYGYECMTRMNCDIHHNIFACNSYAAIARTHVLSGPDKALESKRETNIYDNAFYCNAADLQIPAAGGQWINVPAARIEELDQAIVPKANGNFELPESGPFVHALDQDYLKAFKQLLPSANSAKSRNRMFANRYSIEKALLLFDAMPDYGAAKPQ